MDLSQISMSQDEAASIAVKLAIDRQFAGEDDDLAGISSAPKRRRITRACDRCHKSGIRCSPGAQEGVCAPCATYGSRCTYNRPVKRRGPPPRHLDSNEHDDSRRSSGHFEEWVYHEVAPHEVIEQLVDFYEATIYPIQSCYHMPKLLRRIASREYTHSRPFFADLMSLCALTSARIRDGASYPTHPITSEMRSIPSEAFYHATINAIPSDLMLAGDFEYKRAKNILALLCIQYGDIRGIQRHIGDYCTLMAMDGSHLESRWPSGLDEIETQERRRLFWLAYQLDVYVACTWGSTSRHRESETTVLYPAEVLSDTHITATSIHVPDRNGPEGVSWWRGWNFVTDLYRILEHAIEGVRMKRIRGEDAGPGWQGGQGGPVSALFNRGLGPSNADVLQVVGEMYAELPEVLRVAEAVGEDQERNRFGFQATNIIITLQTVKMVIAGSGESSVSQRCAIAGNLLDAMSNVPTAYIYACSAPVLHHLAGIGHLLGSVIHKPLSQWTYLQVRNCLLSMSDMLANLESVLSRTAGIAQKLRDHVGRIDKYMADAAKERAGRGVQYLAIPWNAGSAGGVNGTPVSTERTGSGVPLREDGSRQNSRNTRSGAIRETARPIASELRNYNASPSVAERLPIDPQLSGPNINYSTSLPQTPGHLQAGLNPDVKDTEELVEITGTGLTPYLPSTNVVEQVPLSAASVPASASDGASGVMLPDDIFADWPFDLGGSAFDFLGDWSGAGVNLGQDGGFPAGAAGVGGSQGGVNGPVENAGLNRAR